jgi:DNA-binding transcriptional ArsR family regulator
MSTNPDVHSGDESFAEQTALTELLGTHPKVKILAVLLSEGRDINISHIAEQAGMSRSTVYDHIEDLQALEVVEQTRKISGSPLYQINKDSDVAEQLHKLEWSLIDVVASE